MPYVDTFTSDNNPFQLSEQRKSASPASRRRTLLSPKRSSRGPSPAHSSSTPSSGVDHSSPLPSTSSSSSPSRNGAAVPQPVTNDLAGLSESTASLSFSDKPLSASTSSPLTTLSPLNTSLPPNTSEWGTLPDSTARLSFSDIHATSPFRFSGRPAQSKQSSAHSATIAGLEAELAELKCGLLPC